MPSTEANSVNVARMCEAFAGLGHHVELFARRSGTGDEAAVRSAYGISGTVGLHLLGRPARIADRKLRHPLDVLALSRRLPPPDLIYGRDPYSVAFAALAMPHVPIAFEVHELPSTRLRRGIERALFTRPSFLAAFLISRALIKDYRAMFPGLAGVDMFLAPDGADPFPAGTIPVTLRGRPGVRQVGYVGQLYPGKGMETVARLAQHLAGVDFHVVGGTEADIAAWRARTTDLRNLTFHGFVPNQQVPSCLAAMDVLLAPPLPITQAVSGRDIGRWMSPLKIFEYMASGRPIVASDIPAVREILVDGHNALLAAPLDTESWAAALRRLEDPALAADIGRRAREDLESKFTWRTRAETIIATLSPRLRPQGRRAGTMRRWISD
jgi:glycosyltransferase involved in cell wall biosynthesis